MGCSELKEVSSIGKIKTIEEGTFKDCEQLMIFNTPESIETIEDSVFENCTKLMFVPLSNGVKYIGNSSFKNCQGLMSINLPEGIEYIGDSAFENCCRIPKYYEVSLPMVGKKESEWQKIRMPNNIIVSIPQSTQSIGKKAFAGCQNITYVHMKEGCKVKEIQDGTFSGCERMENFDISSEVEIIGEEAFKDCIALKQVSCLEQAGLPKEIKSNAFENCENLGLDLTNGEVSNVKESPKVEKRFSINMIKNAINKTKNKGLAR